VTSTPARSAGHPRQQPTGLDAEDAALARALAPRPERRAALALAAVALLTLGWWMLRLGAHEASLVRWDCGGGSCATNDFAGAAPSLGGMAIVLGALLGAGVVRWVAPAVAAVVATSALLLGWRGAVAEGLVTAGAVRVPVVITGVVLALAAVATVVALVRHVRRVGTLARLAGRRAAWARVTDYDTDEQGRVLGTLHFDDARGVRHAVRTVVPRQAFAVPAQALYDPARPDDAARVRVGLPVQPLTAAARRTQEKALRVRVPLPGDDL
jgi:hypothetical protein